MKPIPSFLGYFLALASCVLLLAACEPRGAAENGDSSPSASSSPTPTPPARNHSASVAGEIGVPQGVEPFGIVVYAQGTSISAYTDDEGSYTLSGLSPGEYTLRATRPDLENVVVGEVSVTENDLQKEQPFETMLRVIMDRQDDQASGSRARDFGSLTGRVETIIPRASEGVVVNVENTRHRTVTVEGGAYDILNIKPGDYTLVFEKPGLETARESVTVRAGQEVNVPAVELDFSRGMSARGQGGERTIFGTVALLPADGSEVTDYSSVRVMLEGTSYITTPDNQGQFTFRNVPPDVYTVSASAPGYILEQKYEVNLDAVPAADVELSLVEDTTGVADTGSIYGTVNLEDADRANGVAVSLSGTNHVVFTDQRGDFEIMNLDQGTYDLVASFEGYEPGYVDGIEVQGPEPLDVGEVTLEKKVDRPSVVYTRPADGASDVPIKQPTLVTIQFSQKMDIPSVLDALSIEPEVGYQVDSGGRGNQDSLTIALNALPGRSGEILRYDTEYSVTVGGSARNGVGVAMEEDYEFEFSTGDAMIIATEPRDGAEGARLYPDVPMSVSFNAPIDESTLTADDVRIRPSITGQPDIYFRRDEQTGWSILYIRVFGEPDEEYTVEIGRGVRTVTGHRVENTPYEWSFETTEWIEGSEIYGNSDPDYDVEERERQRRR